MPYQCELQWSSELGAAERLRGGLDPDAHGCTPEGMTVASVPLIVALASPLLHARLRAELARDTDVVILCDTDNPAKAAQEIAALRPPVVLVDRDMVLNPALGQLAQQLNPLPAMVLVTVHREGAPVGHVLPIAGTLAFDARPGEISQHLHDVLDATHVKAALAPASPLPNVPNLKSRFTIAEHDEPAIPAKSAVRGASREPGFSEKAPVPSKTSQLTKTGFLRSVFDVVHVNDRDASSVR